MKKFFCEKCDKKCSEDIYILKEYTDFIEAGLPYSRSYMYISLDIGGYK